MISLVVKPIIQANDTAGSVDVLGPTLVSGPRVDTAVP